MLPAAKMRAAETVASAKMSMTETVTAAEMATSEMAAATEVTAAAVTTAASMTTTAASVTSAAASAERRAGQRGHKHNHDYSDRRFHHGTPRCAPAPARDLLACFLREPHPPLSAGFRSKTR